VPNPNDIVLITGGAGFVGSHLTEHLVARGRRVVILDDLSTGRAENLAHLADHPAVDIREGSVLDELAVAAAARGAGTIVHLAAAVGVQLILDRPVETITTNVRGTENVLAVALAAEARVLVASTSEVYGKGIRYPFAEDDDIVLGPTSKRRWAYAASKMVDEFLCFAYHGQYGLPAIPFRLFNTTGARQTGRYGMVLPRFVRQALEGEPMTVYGDGTQRRCFCDVRDVVAALGGLIDRDDLDVQLYNIGNTEEVTILELAERVRAATGSTSEIVLLPYDEVYPPGFEDMTRRIPDTSRISSLIGWKPERSLDEIIQSVVDHERSRTRALTV
jgi:UDP-glucose 4-epimerase